MSRLLYFDCFSGISGDMVLGALLDAGLPMPALKGALGSLAVDGYHVHAERVLRAVRPGGHVIIGKTALVTRGSGLVTIITTNTAITITIIHIAAFRRSTG